MKVNGNITTITKSLFLGLVMLLLINMNHATIINEENELLVLYRNLKQSILITPLQLSNFLIEVFNLINTTDNPNDPQQNQHIYRFNLCQTINEMYIFDLYSLFSTFELQKYENLIPKSSREYKILEKLHDVMLKEEDDSSYRLTLDEMGISEVYLINLKERPDRHKLMKDRLDKINLPFTWFPAFFGKSIRENFTNNEPIVGLSSESKVDLNLVNKAIKTEENYWNWNTVGCWQSHLHVYYLIRDKMIKTGIDKPVFIIEDDAIFQMKTKNIIKHMLPLLPDDWEIFALGHDHLRVHEDEVGIQFVNYDLIKVFSFLATHAIIYRNLKVINKLIAFSNTSHLQTSDSVTNDMVMGGLLIGYAIDPEVIKQDQGSPSNNLIPSLNFVPNNQTNPDL